MDWGPSVVILYVEFCSFLDELFQYLATALRIFGENVHNQMHRCVSVLVLDVEVGTFVDQRFDDVMIESYDAEMKWAAEDSSAFVDVGATVDEGLSC